LAEGFHDGWFFGVWVFSVWLFGCLVVWRCTPPLWGFIIKYLCSLWERLSASIVAAGKPLPQGNTNLLESVWLLGVARWMSFAPFSFRHLSSF
jgi:hypothetical protein